MKKSVSRGKAGRPVLFVQSFIKDGERRLSLFAHSGLAVSAVYAVYNGIIGIIYASYWFLVMCAYYLVLSLMRAAVLRCMYLDRAESRAKWKNFAMKFTGAMLILLSIVLAYAVYYSAFHGIARANGTIVMITIATYTFYKAVAAAVGTVKTAKRRTPHPFALRMISCADAAASMLSLQRSMLVSFEGMKPEKITVMNTVFGSAVCIFIFVSGLAAILRKQKNGETEKWQNQK
ncbi:MAG: hypothetical protein ACI4SJ_04130 [Candidatus Avispirillum sp.]